MSTSDEMNNNNGKFDPRNKLNDLTSIEWIKETVSVWNQRGLGKNHQDAQIERKHPAPFSFTDVSRLIRFFTKSGDTVLDPFVGIGSTLKACAIEGRNGIGFELNPEYVRLSKERLEKESLGLFNLCTQQIVKEGDSRELINDLDNDSIDFIVTSPPYWNILHKEDHKANQERKSKNLDTKYSDSELDIGNIPEYDKFLDELSSILGNCSNILKPKKYMVVIVSDFRDKSKYIMFHSDLANSLSSYSFELRGITILAQRHKRVFPYGYPFAFVPNIHHQYILIFQNCK
jgi:DNA modification methylase